LLYVVDTAALLTIQNDRSDGPNCFLGLTDLINESKLCFPTEVVEELERLAKEEAALIWAKTAASARCHKGAPFNYVSWVLEVCEDLVDKSALASQEPAAPYVAAQALELKTENVEVTVVTEDVLEKPTRKCLLQACQDLELPYLRLDQFLNEVGLP
jgi:rRNA maturation endonuclease Nob1